MLRITKVSGPLVTAVIEESTDKPKYLETVFVGDRQLLGEIISIENGECKVQVYEETTGIRIGEKVELKGELLSVELGPGLIGNMFDGIQRPLEALDKVSPVFIAPGIHLPSLDQDKKWKFEPIVKKGDVLEAGAKIGYVQETELFKHYIMLLPDVAGEVVSINAGEFTINDVVAHIKNAAGEEIPVIMKQKWPVKIARPRVEKLAPHKIFKTGQRVVDAMFPIMLGAPVCTPGPFGAGKTFTQQQFAKWSDAELVVYVGCGERGNEMTEMVKLFPTLDDPRTGRPLMERTILIANTSNMPIAAREASIYTGITIAEYFRDMGLDVVMMADSTSRWAESMREISARMAEMPSEEGYPAYLSSRISSFYERTGVVKTLSGDEGSVTAIGAVSPAGGDFSEPVTQATLKNTQVFLALDAALAAKRHYPAINWQTSYSLYDEVFDEIISKNSLEDSDKTGFHTDTYKDFAGGAKFIQNRIMAKKLLSEEGELLELVKLIGMDGLDNDKRLILEISKSLREDFLQQNGFDEIDTYCSFKKTKLMMNIIIGLYDAVQEVLKADGGEDEELVAKIFDADLKTALTNLKYIKTEEEVEKTGIELIEDVKKEFMQTA